MQNFSELGRELERRGKTDALRALTASEDGVRLAAMLDGDRLEKAAKSGDAGALRALLGAVLQTEEGRRLAESVRGLMEN